MKSKLEGASDNWKHIGGGIIGGKDVLVFLNLKTHEVSTVEKDVTFDLSKAL